MKHGQALARTLAHPPSFAGLTPQQTDRSAAATIAAHFHTGQLFGGGRDSGGGDGGGGDGGGDSGGGSGGTTLFGAAGAAARASGAGASAAALAAAEAEAAAEAKVAGHLGQTVEELRGTDQGERDRGFRGLT